MGYKDIFTERRAARHHELWLAPGRHHSCGPRGGTPIGKTAIGRAVAAVDETVAAAGVTSWWRWPYLVIGTRLNGVEIPA